MVVLVQHHQFLEQALLMLAAVAVELTQPELLVQAVLAVVVMRELVAVVMALTELQILVAVAAAQVFLQQEHEQVAQAVLV
jgi:hypothetical protein